MNNIELHNIDLIILIITLWIHILITPVKCIIQ